jgi:hypothetical protein
MKRAIAFLIAVVIFAVASAAFAIFGVPAQASPRSTWANTTYIELIVDGQIVDPNRIELPLDTPIIDERFKEAGKK